MGRKPLKETSLYPPLKDFLTARGYEVRGEVKDCDIAAMKGQEMLLVEMKTSLNLEVILQAVQRQKMTDLVYIAVPRGRNSMRSRRWAALCHLLKRLELGLMTVSLPSLENGRILCGFNASVEVVFHPVPFDRKISRARAKAKKEKLIREFSARTADFNTGGEKGRKLVTAYRMHALEVARILAERGPMSPRDIRQLVKESKPAGPILYHNYYGWFERVRHGVYTLTDKGRKESVEFLERMMEGHQ